MKRRHDGAGATGRAAALLARETARSSQVVSRACADWRVFDPRVPLLEGHVHSRVGDCLFACVAFWLNCAMGSTQHNASTVRLLAAAALAEDDAYFEAVVCEIACESGCRPEREAAQQALLRPGVWGCCAVLVLLAKAVSGLLQVPTGFVILKTRDGAYTHNHPILVPSRNTHAAGQGGVEPLVACVLFHVNEDHYRLAASSAPGPLRVLFDPAQRAWRAGLARDPALHLE